MKTVEIIFESLRSYRYPIQLGELGYIELAYRPARIQQHGRLLQPPRHIWVLRKGECLEPSKLKIEELDEAWSTALKEGLSGSVSFELPGLGMCYRHEGFFELLPGKIAAPVYPADFGLNSITVYPLGISKAEAPQILPLSKPKKQRSSLWWLKIAAVFLALLFVNLLTLHFLTEDGKLTINQVAELNPFDSLSERNRFSFDHESNLDQEISEIEAKINRVISGNHSNAASGIDSLNAKTNQSEEEQNATKEDIPVTVQDSKEQNSPIAPKTPEVLPVTKEPQAAEKAKTAIKKPEKVVVEEVKIANVPEPVVKQEASQPAKATKVVVGVFAAVQNAENLKKELAKSGWKSTIEVSANGTRHRVIVLQDAFKTNEEAFLQQAKEKINPQSWILAD